MLCYDGYLTPANQLKTSHCIGASHVRDNVDRHFSEQEQQENQQKLQQNIAQPWTQDVNTSDNLARVGIRCSVRDLAPMIGNVPNFEQQQADYYNLFNLRRRKQHIQSAANFQNLFLNRSLRFSRAYLRSTLRRNLSFNHLWRAITNKRSHIT